MAKVGRKPGSTISEATREKQRLAHLGKKYNISPEGHRAMSESAKRVNANRTPEQIEAWRLQMVGRKHTQETKDQMSRSHKGLVRTAEHCQHISESKKGKCSDALRASCLKNFRASGSFMGQFESLKSGRTYPYRSRYEEAYMRLLEADPDVVKFDYEPFFVRFRVDGVLRFYLPDFFVLRQNSKVLVEVKPKNFTHDKLNAKKWAAAKRLCQKKGWEFQLVTEEDLGLSPISNQAGGLRKSDSLPEGSQTRELGHA